MMFMKCFIFLVVLHLLRTIDGVTKFQLSSLRLSAQHRELEEECPWLDYTAADFRGAASDPIADAYNSSGSPYYHYDYCYDLGLDSLRQASANIGNCAPEYDDFFYDADGFDCYSETSITRVGCCLGNGMYVVFTYNYEDVQLSISESRCGSSSKYINANVFPNATTCSVAFGDNSLCGTCLKGNGSSASALGWSCNILAMMSLLMILLHV